MKAQFEKISLPLENSFKAFEYKSNHFDASWHFHPEYELTYIVKGKGVRYVGNNVQQFEEGDFVLLGSNLPHCWIDSPENEDGVHSIVFQFDEDLIGKGWLQKKEFKNINLLLEKANKGIRFNPIENHKIIRRLVKSVKKAPFEKLIQFLKILNNLSKTQYSESLASIDFSPNLNTKANKRIDMVHAYVQEHYSTKIKLEEISSLVAMSEGAFCRFFKKTLNKSFFTFLNEYRVSIACSMLIETNKQVNQIAYECGYETTSLFFKQFQKFVGTTPLAYKKRYINYSKYVE